MTTTPKRRPRVGDEAWFVQWCAELGFYPDSDEVDRDACKMKVRQFASEEDARQFAEEVWPHTHETFGVVECWPSRFVPYDEDDAGRYPHAGFWDATADSIYFSGEWEE